MYLVEIIINNYFDHKNTACKDFLPQGEKKIQTFLIITRYSILNTR